MLEAGRAGRLRGAGFYDYDESGKRGSIWSGLAELFPVAEEQIPIQDIKDRMLFAEALETAKCFEEGVIEPPPRPPTSARSWASASRP